MSKHHPPHGSRPSAAPTLGARHPTPSPHLPLAVEVVRRAAAALRSSQSFSDDAYARPNPNGSDASILVERQYETWTSLAAAAASDATDQMIRCVVGINERFTGGGFWDAHRRSYRSCGLVLDDVLYVAYPDPDLDATEDGELRQDGRQVMGLLVVPLRDVTLLDETSPARRLPRGAR